jgi:hypothetical protein
VRRRGDSSTGGLDAEDVDTLTGTRAVVAHGMGDAIDDDEDDDARDIKDCWTGVNVVTDAVEDFSEVGDV